MKVPKQQVTKLIDALCSHQFVERAHNEKDRRSIQIRLTPKAVSYLDEYHLKNTAFIHMLEEQTYRGRTEPVKQRDGIAKPDSAQTKINFGIFSMPLPPSTAIAGSTDYFEGRPKT